MNNQDFGPERVAWARLVMASRDERNAAHAYANAGFPQRGELRVAETEATARLRAAEAELRTLGINLPEFYTDPEAAQRRLDTAPR